MEMSTWIQAAPWFIRGCISRLKDLVIILGGIVMAQLLLSDSVHRDLAGVVTSRAFFGALGLALLVGIIFVVRSRLGFDQPYFQSLSHQYKGSSHPKPLRYWRGRQTAMDNMDVDPNKGFHHRFYYRRANVLTRPTYCNVCRQLMAGGTNDSLCCEVCGYCAHSQCVAKAKRNCKPLWSSRSEQKLHHLTRKPGESVTSSKMPVHSAASLGMEHHWVEGNHSTVRDMCLVCGGAVGSLLGLGGLRCVWCRLCIHQRCRTQAPKVCSLGNHYKLVLPPCCVSVATRRDAGHGAHGGQTRPKGSRKRSQSKKGSRHNKHSGSGDTGPRLTIQLPPWCTPVLVFVNGKSGGRQGERLRHQFLSLLNPIQVHDLAHGGPEPGLSRFRDLSRFRILVCGGDGSVSWVLTAIDKLKFEQRDPPVAVLPIGTGNDLARVLGWGGSYSDAAVETLLHDVLHAHTFILDRWDVSTVCTSEPHVRIKDRDAKVMTNYLGIGLDGIIATRFHELREGHPTYFGSQIINKLWYGQLGARAYIMPPDDPLQGVTVSVDGKEMCLDGLQGVVVLNISSYGGGSDLWGTSELEEDNDHHHDHHHHHAGDAKERGGEQNSMAPLKRLSTRSLQSFDKPSHHDGKLEVVGIRDSLHMAKCQVGIAACVRLGQGEVIKIMTSRIRGILGQIDGEPWSIRQGATVTITHRKQAVMLSKSRTKEDGIMDRIEQVLTEAEIAKVITAKQHSYLLNRMVKCT
uniref:Diacylglycerol kinase n=1 Tax=Lotharella globosa TaxID=91324 RepID=A0A7S3Z6U3_9EUKA|mmetsp:Transcript_24520/g.47877  ORF Transcript_24520/g.47877 Transcript_24520/m.47877 type:complete len:740 (+) Transcript_24520:33-2252(+)